MNTLSRLGEWLKKTFLVAITAVCVVAIFWGILYKIFLPFTPPWVDEITIVALPIALLIAWAIGRSAGSPRAGDERHVQPPEAVPDAATQLESNEPFHSE